MVGAMTRSALCQRIAFLRRRIAAIEARDAFRPSERIPKKLIDFFDENSLKLIVLARILIDRTIPCDRKAR
jgi:hypothetical protein